MTYTSAHLVTSLPSLPAYHGVDDNMTRALHCDWSFQSLNASPSIKGSGPATEADTLHSVLNWMNQLVEADATGLPELRNGERAVTQVA